MPIPFQRDEPIDSPELVAQVAETQARLAAAIPPMERLALLGRLGEDCRRLGLYAEAIAASREAVALARVTADRRREAANLIRLATALQYANAHAEAETRFRDALRLTETHPAAGYRDYALQHLGKCLVERDRVADAVACFEQALTLREAGGNPDLLASTRRALRSARALLTGASPA